MHQYVSRIYIDAITFTMISLSSVFSWQTKILVDKCGWKWKYVCFDSKGFYDEKLYNVYS